MSIGAGNGMFNGYRSTKPLPAWKENAILALFLFACLIFITSPLWLLAIYYFH